MTGTERGTRTSNPGQVVLESDPYRYLSYTWHTFTPEWARTVGVSEEVLAKLAAEQKSKVIFEIEPAGELVKLTVMHEFGAAHTLAGMCSQIGPPSCPASELSWKTGEPLPAPRPDRQGRGAVHQTIVRCTAGRAPPDTRLPLPGRASKRASKCPMRLC
jgi:hypothetical protein